jgi:hypothetical protein
VTVNAPPILAVFIEIETPVVVRLFSDNYEDERRIALDVLLRPDLLDEIAIALDAFLIEQRGDVA